jgi:hypothetical protein
MRFGNVLVVSALHLACAAAPPPRAARASAPSAASVSNRRAQAAPPPSGAAAENGVAEADAVARDALAVPGRDERFSADRQIAELERAIGLYRQFLERAGDDPRFAGAVARSRDHIADAQQTIAFLRQQSGVR